MNNIPRAIQTLPVIDPRIGEIHSAQIFVAVLGASNYTYKAVADFAWEELRRLSWNGEVKPIGLTYTCNGKQVDYIDLTSGVG